MGIQALLEAAAKVTTTSSQMLCLCTLTGQTDQITSDSAVCAIQDRQMSKASLLKLSFCATQAL